VMKECETVRSHTTTETTIATPWTGPCQSRVRTHDMTRPVARRHAGSPAHRPSACSRMRDMQGDKTRQDDEGDAILNDTHAEKASPRAGVGGVLSQEKRQADSRQGRGVYPQNSTGCVKLPSPLKCG
jgi:hypothetical protein